MKESIPFLYSDVQFVEKINEGGMGEIWKVMDMHTQKYYIVKKPKIALRSLYSSPESEFAYLNIERFFKEIETLIILNSHPHIVGLLDFTILDDTPLFLMEFVSQGTLRDIITKEKLSLEEILALAFQIAYALDYVQKLGLIHRDLKPENILVNQNKNFLGMKKGLISKLTDFGIVSSENFRENSNNKVTSNDSSTFNTSGFIGTLGYSSPEQLNGIARSFSSDIYSFGVILFEMITGKRPDLYSWYQDEDLDGNIIIRYMINDNSYSPKLEEYVDDMLANSNIECPRGLKDIVKSCLQFDPSRRWMSDGNDILGVDRSDPNQNFDIISGFIRAIYEDYFEKSVLKLVMPKIGFAEWTFRNTCIRLYMSELLKYYKQLQSQNGDSEYYNSRYFIQYMKSLIIGGNGNEAEAIRLCDTALNLNSNFSRAYLAKAFILSKTDIWNKKENEIKKILQISLKVTLKDPFAYYIEGLILMKYGDYHNASLSFDRAIELDDKFDLPYYGKYQVCLKQGDTTGILKWLDEASQKSNNRHPPELLRSIWSITSYKYIRKIHDEVKEQYEGSHSTPNHIDNSSSTVYEAYTRDVGHGVARIDHESMDALNVTAGDVLEIQATRKTVARCLPLYPSDEGKGMIRIDGIVRHNAGVSINGTVVIKKTRGVPAEKITLTPLESIPQLEENYLSTSLSNISIIIGDKIMITYSGTRFTFQITEIISCTNDDAAIITEETKIKVSAIDSDTTRRD